MRLVSRFAYLAALLLISAFPPICRGGVGDPVKDFLENRDRGGFRGSVEFYSDDKVFRFEVDLNNDGKKEVLVSSSHLRNGKQGAVYFVYTPASGGFELVGQMELYSSGFYLGPIDEIQNYGVVKFFPAGGGCGG